MSRQELAEAVNAYVLRKLGVGTSIDGDHVGRLERGQHRWPIPIHREAFRVVLGASSDAELGFYIIRGQTINE